jgi:hypothetical protein
VTRPAVPPPRHHDHAGHDDPNLDPALRVRLGAFAAEMPVVGAIRFVGTRVPPAKPVETGGP